VSDDAAALRRTTAWTGPARVGDTPDLSGLPTQGPIADLSAQQWPREAENGRLVAVPRPAPMADAGIAQPDVSCRSGTNEPAGRSEAAS
jgi:hypothetical protein